MSIFSGLHHVASCSASRGDGTPINLSTVQRSQHNIKIIEFHERQTKTRGYNLNNMFRPTPPNMYVTTDVLAASFL